MPTKLSPAAEQVAWLFRKALNKGQRKRSVGVEVERFAVWPDGTPLSYSPRSVSGKERPGMGELLGQLSQKNHWEGVQNDEGQLLGLKTPTGKVSLEPGSQLEFSSNPFPSPGAAIQAVSSFEAEVGKLLAQQGLRWLNLAVHPFLDWDELELIPNPRYQIMTDYMQEAGRLGTSMMRLTSSVQVNLDYQTEEEAIDMLRTALLAVPLSYALFGNSPLSLGKESGFLSFRAEIWRETDPDRTGLLPHVFDPDFSLAAHASYLSERKLMYVCDDDNEFASAKGLSLSQLAQGKLDNVSLNEKNSTNAIQQNFPEVRLKPGYLEVRAIDGLPEKMRAAATALWTAMLYSPAIREHLHSTFGEMSSPALFELWVQSTKRGLSTLHGVRDLLAVSEEVVQEAKRYLQQHYPTDVALLEPIQTTLELQKNPAQLALEAFRKGGKPDLLSVTTSN